MNSGIASPLPAVRLPAPVALTPLGVRPAANVTVHFGAGPAPGASLPVIYSDSSASISISASESDAHDIEADRPRLSGDRPSYIDRQDSTVGDLANGSRPASPIVAEDDPDPRPRLDHKHHAPAEVSHTDSDEGPGGAPIRSLFGPLSASELDIIREEAETSLYEAQAQAYRECSHRSAALSLAFALCAVTVGIPLVLWLVGGGRDT